jgi:surfactin synthase thioesterase subunit
MVRAQSLYKTPWLIPMRSSCVPTLKLFCFPFAGAGGSIFRSWADRLPPEIELCPVQLPGRENRILEPPFHRMLSLADAATDALLPHFTRPFAFFGHSMGATLAFEIARQLERRRHPGPRFIIVSASPAPQLPRKRAPTFNLPDAELIRELDELKGTPLEVLQNAELLQVILPGVRADFEVVETYTYENVEIVECPIIAIGGQEDPRVSSEDLDGWRTQTSGEFSRQNLPGNHFFLVSTPGLVAETVVELTRKYTNLW